MPTADTDDELVNRRDIKVMVESLQDNRGEEPTVMKCKIANVIAHFFFLA